MAWKRAGANSVWKCPLLTQTLSKLSWRSRKKRFFEINGDIKKCENKYRANKHAVTPYKAKVQRSVGQKRGVAKQSNVRYRQDAQEAAARIRDSRRRIHRIRFGGEGH